MQERHCFPLCSEEGVHLNPLDRHMWTSQASLWTQAKAKLQKRVRFSFLSTSRSAAFAFSLTSFVFPWVRACFFLHIYCKYGKFFLIKLVWYRSYAFLCIVFLCLGMIRPHHTLITRSLTAESFVSAIGSPMRYPSFYSPPIFTTLFLSQDTVGGKWS